MPPQIKSCDGGVNRNKQHKNLCRSAVLGVFVCDGVSCHGHGQKREFQRTKAKKFEEAYRIRYLR